MNATTRRRLRYASPVVVAGVVGLAASLPSLAAGASTPDLPSITAQQLIAKVAASSVPAWQGTVTLTPNLGLPSLSALTSAAGQGVSSSSGFDPTTLLSGSHTIEVWTDGDKQRLALPTTMAETDIVRNGNQAWLYDSGTQHVDHYVLAMPSGDPAESPAPGATELTPEQVAAKVIAAITPSTDVTESVGADVAGQKVYDLTLAPKAGTSEASNTTLDRIVVSVDAANGLPLEVAVYGKSSAAPVVELGYTSVSFTTPAASNFSAPVGTSTTTHAVNPGGRSPGSGFHRDGFGGRWSRGYGGAESAGRAFQPGAQASAPAGQASAPDKPAVTGGPWAQVVTFNSTKVANSSELRTVTTAVSGAFGTGRLLHTSLVNALVLPDGRILVGFVTPAVLESAAGSAA